MQLEQLKTFIAVVELKNFTKTAVKLNMSQPTVSLHIKNLEEELNTPLFIREKKSFHITPAGNLLYKRAIQLLRLAEQTKEEILWQHKEVNGVLRVAASYTIGESVLPDVLVRMHDKYPDLQIEVTIKNTEEVATAVRELKCDVGLIEGSVKASELMVQPFKEDKLLLVASKNHPLAKRDVVRIEELLYTHWVMREEGSGTREYTDYILQGIGNIKPSKTIISTNEGVRQAVLSTLGIAALSIHTVNDDITSGEIVHLNVEIEPLIRTFAVLSTPLMADKRHVQVFLTALGTN